jgi:ribosomal protein S18 acetylase RimI-like enzyme
MVTGPEPRGRVRPGEERDEEAVQRITEQVFTVFGEYSWLPGYLGHPGVWTYVHETGGRVDGFAMLGILDAREEPGDRIGDLLAIAVCPGRQDRGIGRALLARIVEKARALTDSLGLVELRLTVAEPNDRARHLFETFGFEAVDGDHGRYERGQRALRLRLGLEPE